MKTLHILLLFISLGVVAIPAQANADGLKIGISLHPYYAYVKNIVGDRATVLPLIESGFNPHNYALNPADIARLNALDALVINGIGHDEFVIKAVERINPPDLTVIHANRDVPLLSKDGTANPHTFIAIDAAIRQIYTIAKALGQLDPPNASFFIKNAFAYAQRLRALKQPVQALLIEHDLSALKIASTHNAYGYLLHEFGMVVAAVVEPAHGVKPSASQLQQTIDEIRKVDIDVLFTELNMSNDYIDVIEQETGIKIYHFSHMTHGDYRADMVVAEMQHNLDTLAEAIRFAALTASNAPQE